jgi:hypothetical protein
MHRNGAIVLRLQCEMNSESVPKPGTLPHMYNNFGPSDLMVYGLLLNIHVTIK